MSMWSNDIKCKFMFMFPLQNLARKGLRNPTYCLFYSVITKSIPYLLMPWWLKEPGHQQDCCWPNKPEFSVCSIIKVLIYQSTISKQIFNITSYISGLSIDILKMESWMHLGRTANIIVKDVIHNFLRPSAKSCVFCWWDGVIASAVS